MFEHSDATFLVFFQPLCYTGMRCTSRAFFADVLLFIPIVQYEKYGISSCKAANYEEERINKEKVNRSNSRYKRKALAQRRHIANVGQIKSVTNHVRRVLEQADILGRYRNGKRTNFPERVRRLGCLLFQKYFCTFSRISNPQKTEQKLFQKIFKGTKIFLLHLFENIYF